MLSKNMLERKRTASPSFYTFLLKYSPEKPIHLRHASSGNIVIAGLSGNLDKRASVRRLLAVEGLGREC
ncbi:MAG: hypothetical protein ABWW69_01170 [Pyrodictiaceae archaeon]